MSDVASTLDVRKRLFFLLELTVLLAAFFLSALVGSLALDVQLPRGAVLSAALSSVGALAGVLYLADLYDLKVAYADAPRGARLLRALGAVSWLAGLLALVLPLGPGLLVGVAGLGGACTAALFLRGALPELGERLQLRPRVLVVGRGAAAGQLLSELARDGQCEVVGGALPEAADLAQRAIAARAEAVVVATSEHRGTPLGPLLACRLEGLEVLTAAQFAERVLQKLPVELLRLSDLVYSDGFARSGVSARARRALSVAASLALLALAAPLILLTAALIRIDSPGPLFYAQERVGLRGRTFRMLKFRTMRVGAEAPGRAQWAQRNDPRVTRVGRWLRRFRIDELPQILNVLKGEMNLVGPRPERPEFVARLRTVLPYYDLRALVPPGITGWAQIRYPYAASLEEAREKLKYDLFYVKHLSVRQDLRILFHTARVVLFGRGAR